MKKAISVILLLCILVLINYIGSLTPNQVDLTAANTYTLSLGTRSILAKVEEPVEIHFFFSRSTASLPIYFKNYASRIEGLLKQYQTYSNGQITLHIIDPKPDSEEEELALRHGIQSQMVPNGDLVYFGMVISQADQDKVIPVFAQSREEFLEYDISQALHEVQQLEKPKLGLISALPLIAPPYNPYNPQANSGETWIVASELQNTFAIENLTGDSIPQNIDALAIIHPPAGLSPAMLYAIDQYLLSGKPVFLAVDPSSRYQQSRINPQAMMMGGGGDMSSDLPNLLTAWGISYDPASVIGDLALATPISAGQGGGAIYFPVWLSIKDFVSESPATSQLEMVQLIQAGTFRLKNSEELQLQTFIQSSLESNHIMASTLNFTAPENIAQEIIPDQQNRSIAGLISGTFTTAFPEGAPLASDASEEEQTAHQALTLAEKTKGSLLKSKQNSRLFLITDTDFLSDDFSVQRSNFMGTPIVQPINDNLSFAINIMEMLIGSQDLISIRSKGDGLRPFTRIEAMQRKAQKLFQTRLEQVEARVSNVQEELQKLQNQSGNQGDLIASPEILQAIERLQEEEAQARAERRNIRKELREDIESLEMTLAVANLSIVPLGLLIFSIQFFIRRNKRKHA